MHQILYVEIQIRLLSKLSSLCFRNEKSSRMFLHVLNIIGCCLGHEIFYRLKRTSMFYFVLFPSTCVTNFVLYCYAVLHCNYIIVVIMNKNEIIFEMHMFVQL